MHDISILDFIWRSVPLLFMLFVIGYAFLNLNNKH